MCLVHLVLDFPTFISNLILLVLYCCIIVLLSITLTTDASGTVATCSAINRFTHIYTVYGIIHSNQFNFCGTLGVNLLLTR